MFNTFCQSDISCLLYKCKQVGCDATNALVWQNTKLHNLKVSSFYPLVDIDVATFDDFVSEVECNTMFADLKPLSNGTTAPFLHGVILDQLRQVGAPTWRDADGLPNSNHINIWIMNTDAGGDISKCRRNIEFEARGQDHIVVLGG